MHLLKTPHAICALLTILTVTGCGSDDIGQQAVALLAGKPVSGLQYTVNGIQKTTGSGGQYEAAAGVEVEWSIQGYVLGRTQAGEITDLANLSSDETLTSYGDIERYRQQSVVLASNHNNDFVAEAFMGQVQGLDRKMNRIALLMNLDADNNPSNGIDLSNVEPAFDLSNVALNQNTLAYDFLANAHAKKMNLNWVSTSDSLVAYLNLAGIEINEPLNKCYGYGSLEDEPTSWNVSYYNENDSLLLSDRNFTSCEKNLPGNPITFSFDDKIDKYMQYNEAGQLLTERQNTDGSDAQFTLKYQYDYPMVESGSQINVEIYDSNDALTLSQYKNQTFDEDGLLIRNESSNDNLYINTYEYNEAGLIHEEVFYSSSNDINIPTSTSNYTYDANNLLIFKTSVGSATNDYLYEYNDLGLKVSYQHNVDAHIDVVSISYEYEQIFTYDPVGRLLSEAYITRSYDGGSDGLDGDGFTGNGEISRHRKTSYEYNDAGQIIEKTELNDADFDGTAETVNAIQTYRYDDMGRVVEYCDGDLCAYKVEYRYLESGLLEGQTLYYDGELSSHSMVNYNENNLIQSVDFYSQTELDESNNIIGEAFRSNDIEYFSDSLLKAIQSYGDVEYYTPKSATESHDYYHMSQQGLAEHIVEDMILTPRPWSSDED